MDEYGRTTVEGDVRDFPMSPFIGQQILAIRTIHYRDGNVDFAIGITIQFTGGTVRVLNLADDLILAHEQHLGAVEKYLHEAGRPTACALAASLTGDGRIPSWYLRAAVHRCEPRR
ncbi:hypothetical protein [Streptomyces sp. NPDC053079]|uniref:hypothetical protein n=1 Tax=Streptomyces sp. NPDC053079 TaxID=3365697 RepID=UPI0037D81E92